MSIARKEGAGASKIKYPAVKSIEFKSSKQAFSYYDSGTQENVLIPVSKENPFEFVVVDEYSAITGFCEKTNTGIYSNEVKNLKQEPLNVRVFTDKDGKGAGEIANGLYADIKDTAKAQGGKFTKVVYIIYNNELCVLRLLGAGFAGGIKNKKDTETVGGWINRQGDDSQFKVKCEALETAVKGINNYFVPVFTQGEVITEEEYKLGVKALNDINEYYEAKQEAKREWEENQGIGNETDKEIIHEAKVPITQEDRALSQEAKEVFTDTKKTVSIEDLPF